MSNKATAYAYYSRSDGINVRTIGDTPRFAMVNALCTAANVMATVEFTDAQIEESFDKELGSEGKIVKVDIEVTGEG